MRGLAILLGVVACWTPAKLVQAAPRTAVGSEDLQAQNERAREKFRLGINAFRAERFEEARQLLAEAWRLRRTYDVAASLAQVEYELGHHARAAELLDFCLNNFAPIESDTKFQQLQQAFEQVRARVGHIDLSALPSTAEIKLDGASFVTAAASSPMYLEPGLHDFTIRVAERSTQRTLLVQAGGQYRLEVDPVRPPAKPPIAQPAGAARPPKPSAAAGSGTSRPTFPYYVGGALFLGGLASAVVFQAAASDANSRKQSLLSRPDLSDCSATGATSTPLCSELSDANADYQFNRNLSVFGYGLAATAAIATAIYWLWPEPSGTQSTGTSRASTWMVGYDPTRLWIATTGVF